MAVQGVSQMSEPWNDQAELKRLFEALFGRQKKFRSVEEFPLLDMVCPQCGKPMGECKCHD